MTIRFDDAWQGAQQIAHEASEQGIDTVLVRDVMGRVSLVLDGEPTQALVSRLSSALNAVAGNFVAWTPVMLASDMFDPSPVIETDDLIIRAPRTENAGRLAYLERTVVGADWIRSTDRPAANRMTLYGFKGGIGRSTATFMLAEHLARQGKCVLAVDLDLESPGLGALAQSEKDLGQHGIVDYLVEAAVGNADGLELVTRSNLITGSHNGEAWLTPAAGQDNANYLAKLNRIYSDLPGMS